LEPVKEARLALPLELPVACVWRFPRAAGGAAGDELGGELPPGVAALSSGGFAVLPLPGDAAVFDAAVALARRWLAVIASRQEGRNEEARILITPGVARCDSVGLDLVPDPLLDDFAERAPRLARGDIHLTARSAQGLEQGFRFQPAGTYEAPSGRVVPLVRLGPERFDTAPWRNPEVLGRRLRWIQPPLVDEHLEQELRQPALRIVGPLGVGKSRTVAEAARRLKAVQLWAAPGSARAATASLAEQLLRQTVWTATPEGERPASALGQLEALLAALAAAKSELGEGPVWVVLDGLEAASAAEWRWVEELLAAPELGKSFRLVLIGRHGTPWAPAARKVPELRLTPLVGEPFARLGEQLFAGLALPAAVATRWIEVAAGNPFALEEGTIQLAASKRLRRIYGSFFWSGEEDAAFTPSPRFVRHLEAEATRLGDALPLRLLAAVGHQMPLAEVNSAAQLLELPVALGWETPFLAAGWLGFAEGPWGEGIEIASPALGAALDATLTPEARRRVRETAGELLAHLSQPGRGRWLASRLLVGTTEGARLLLGCVTAPASEVPRSQVFAALQEEVRGASERGDTGLEGDLLWALLPLARRLGRLHQIEAQLERALVLVEGRGERFLAIAALAAEYRGHQGRHREAESILRQALAPAPDRDERRRSLLFLELGRVLLRQGRYGEARELFERTLSALEPAKRAALAAQCRFQLGNIAFHENRLVEAEELHSKALAERRRAGLHATAAASLSALGAVLLAVGNYPQSLTYYGEAQALLREHGREGEESFALIGMGRAQARLGDYAGAAHPLRAALTQRQGRDDPMGEAIARLAVADVLHRLGQSEEALAEARRAHFDVSLLPESETRGGAERLLGEILLGQRKLGEATRYLNDALQVARRLRKPLAEAEALGWLIEAGIAGGEAPAVARHAAALSQRLESLHEPAEAETHWLRLFRASFWLRERGERAPEPRWLLERAYRELVRQTTFLLPEMRHRFLFQIDEHRAIVAAATQFGLSLPGS